MYLITHILSITDHVQGADAKKLLILVGSIEVKMLFNHIGRVMEADSWEEALNKVLIGIAGQTNQVVARFNLM